MTKPLIINCKVLQVDPGLFDDELLTNAREARKQRPLADRMRPESFSRFIGQTNIVGEAKPLRKLIEEDSFGSLLLWGPPGTGKTTLARIASNVSGREFIALSAVETGIKELKEVVKAARHSAERKKKTILFIDEIHRYNKTQQDALLPHVESGLITLIGATTENPSFGVIPALRSRCRVVELTPLLHDEILKLIEYALEDKESGLGDENLRPAEAAIEQIALFASGDGRVALTLLESCAKAATEGSITRKLVEEVSQKASLLYDKAGQQHYDHASAFIKSMRGSDPDAAIYWMGRMLSAGEDPRFIARRLIIAASEDVGNADPTALILAVAAAEAVEKIGLPEGRIPLAQATLYIACAPKSNASYKAINKVVDHLKKSGTAAGVPTHLRDTSYKDAKKLGHGKGYKYAHDYPNHYVEQTYLPDALKGLKFYEPSPHGREATFEERLKEIKSKFNRRGR